MKRVDDPVPGDRTVRPLTVTSDDATRTRMGLATHCRVRAGMWWPDALRHTSADFDSHWFPRGLTPPRNP